MFHWCGRSAGAICYGQKIYPTNTFYFMQFHRGYPQLSNFLWMFTDMLLFRNVSHVDLLKRLYCFAVFQTFFYVDDHYILFQQTLWISVCNSSLWHAFSSVIFVTGSIGKFCGNVNKKYQLHLYIEYRTTEIHEIVLYVLFFTGKHDIKHCNASSYLQLVFYVNICLFFQYFVYDVYF